MRDLRLQLFLQGRLLQASWLSTGCSKDLRKRPSAACSTGWLAKCQSLDSAGATSLLPVVEDYVEVEAPEKVRGGIAGRYVGKSNDCQQQVAAQ